MRQDITFTAQLTYIIALMTQTIHVATITRVEGITLSPHSDAMAADLYDTTFNKTDCLLM